MLTRLARPLEIALGALFIVTAAFKALNVYGFAVQVAAYGIVRDPEFVQGIAYAMIGLETVLGIALLAGFRMGGFAIVFTAATLVMFTGLIGYSWAFKGLADCGCFGDFVKMGPGASIAKNLGLLVMAGLIWLSIRPRPRGNANTPGGSAPVAAPPASSKAGFVLAGIGVFVVAAAFAVGKPAPAPASVTAVKGPATTQVASAPFSEFVPDLGGAPVPLAEGEFFVAMLSATCDHCRAVTATLNQLTTVPGVPQIAALMLGNEEEMKDYKAVTEPQFPTQAIDALAFMKLLGDASAPPCFYIIRNGREVRHLVAEEPSYDELLAFATKAEPAVTEQQH